MASSGRLSVEPPGNVESAAAGPSSRRAPGDELAGTRQPTTRTWPSEPQSGFLFDVQLWLGDLPWRPAAAWSVVAGALAVGIWQGPGGVDQWRPLLIALLLADALWSSIWHAMAGHRAQGGPVNDRPAPRLWLPYLQSGSLAARLLGWDGPGQLSIVMGKALPSLALAGLTAAILGPWAVGLTLLMFILSGLGLLQRRVALIPLDLIRSLVSHTLPWALVLGMVATEQILVVRPLDLNLQVGLLLLWTVHGWGEYRCLRQAQDGSGLLLLAGAELGMAILLILAQVPLWLTALVALWLPTWLAVSRQIPLRRVRFWWVAAMWVSGLALGLQR